MLTLEPIVPAAEVASVYFIKQPTKANLDQITRARDEHLPRRGNKKVSRNANEIDISRRRPAQRARPSYQGFFN